MNPSSTTSHHSAVATSSHCPASPVPRTTTAGPCSPDSPDPPTEFPRPGGQVGEKPSMWRRRRSLLGACTAATVAVLAAVTVSTANADAPPSTAKHGDDIATTTPIKHVVVIFGENISFDHYFGTYPN